MKKYYYVQNRKIKHQEREKSKVLTRGEEQLRTVEILYSWTLFLLRTVEIFPEPIGINLRTVRNCQISHSWPPECPELSESVKTVI